MLSRDKDCLLPVEEAGVLWDSVCFLLLLLQRRVFLSHYFLYVRAELQATALQASRSAPAGGPLGPICDLGAGVPGSAAGLWVHARRRAFPCPAHLHPGLCRAKPTGRCPLTPLHSPVITPGNLEAAGSVYGLPVAHGQEGVAFRVRPSV